MTNLKLLNKKPKKLKLMVKVIYDVFLVALIPLITIMYNEISKDRKLLNDINNILIGESADYCDGCFGVPIFQVQNDENGIDERVYNNKYVIIRAYFKNSSLIGFFVTAKKNDGKIELPAQFSDLLDEKPLGKFTFKEIPNIPISVQIYESNGVAHSFYSEKYYLGSSSNYYYLYFMELEYGFNNMVYDEDAFESDIELEDVDLDYYPGTFLIDRNKSFPNTYGMVNSDLNDPNDLNEINKLISSYYNYNFYGLY